MAKQRIGVIFGGASQEHDVSLLSAYSVIKNIPEDKYEIICIGITKRGRWLYFPGEFSLIPTGEWETYSDCCPAIISPDPIHRGIIKFLDDGTISQQRVDVIFPVLHGKFGEDGTIQGLCELANIPYVGCNLLSSAMCLDKAITHTVLTACGIKNAKFEIVLRNKISALDMECERIEKSLSYPMFVKPANCGSSIGINKAENRTDLKNAIKLAFTHDVKVVVEEQIIGKEIECSVIGNDFPSASVLGEIRPANEFYDYDAKYVLNTSELIIPADLNENLSKKVRETAISAYKALNCSGLSRVDFFVNEETNEITLNEINTMPGFTTISMYPKLLEQRGISYHALIDTLITLAFERNSCE